MIIVRMFGGLGNQMFQFAAARSLALARGVPLRVDISDYAVRRTHQGFELGRIFDAPIEVATLQDLQDVLGWCWSGPVRRSLAHPRLRGLGIVAFVVEPSFRYWQRLSEAPQNIYLSGYWQSERYFESHASRILQDFQFSQPLDINNMELAAQIERAPSVSLHLRRGDYVSNRRAAATHGVCSVDYYERAMHYVSARVQGARFFVFSDDIAWAQAHLPRIFDCRFIGHNSGANSHIDMRLMSLCQHHVLANSSFSWWGAWLGRNLNKTVVAPQRWFRAALDDADLVPSRWARL